MNAGMMGINSNTHENGGSGAIWRVCWDMPVPALWTKMAQPEVRLRTKCGKARRNHERISTLARSRVYLMEETYSDAFSSRESGCDVKLV